MKRILVLTVLLCMACVLCLDMFGCGESRQAQQERLERLAEGTVSYLFEDDVEEAARADDAHLSIIPLASEAGGAKCEVDVRVMPDGSIVITGTARGTSKITDKAEDGGIDIANGTWSATYDETFADEEDYERNVYSTQWKVRI